MQPVLRPPESLQKSHVGDRGQARFLGPNAGLAQRITTRYMAQKQAQERTGSFDPTLTFHCTRFFHLPAPSFRNSEAKTCQSSSATFSMCR